MAKKVIVQEKKSSVGYPYPSRYGSHKSMIDEEKSKALNNPALVVCTDEWGDYTTYIDRLDSGLADPKRCNGNRVRYEKDKKK